MTTQRLGVLPSTNMTSEPQFVYARNLHGALDCSSAVAPSGLRQHQPLDEAGAGLRKS